MDTINGSNSVNIEVLSRKADTTPLWGQCTSEYGTYVVRFNPAALEQWERYESAVHGMDLMTFCHGTGEQRQAINADLQREYAPISSALAEAIGVDSLDGYTTRLDRRGETDVFDFVVNRVTEQ